MPRRRKLCQNPTTDFAFVTYTNPAEARNPEVQRIVRSHVMKDIGPARRKRPRCTVINLELKGAIPSDVPHAAEAADAPGTVNSTPGYVNYDSICSLPRPNPIGILGIDLTPRALELVNFMMVDTEYNYRAFHVVWIRIGLSDSTCFYLTLASATLFMDRVRRRLGPDIEDSAESNRYYLRALQQLNMRLSNKAECTSPGVIATILGCLCHDTHINDWDRWAIHIKGLKRLSDRRGGFDGLEEHIALTAWWLDLVGCSVFDQQPRFAIPRDLASAPDISPATHSDLRIPIKQIVDDLPEMSPILHISIKMGHLVEIVKTAGSDPCFWEDAVGGISLIGPLIHQLLTMPRLSDHPLAVKLTPTLIAQELMRLVFLMLLSCLKKCLSLNASDMGPLQYKMSLILAHEPDSDSVVTKNLIKWATSTFTFLKKSYMSNAEDARLHFVQSIENLLTTLKVNVVARDVGSAEKVHPRC